MFNRLRRLFHRKDEDSPAFRRAMAEKLDGRNIRYVTERQEGIETVIGREGHANMINDNEFAVTSGIETLFLADIEEMKAWELLSLEGAVLTAFDKHTGRERSIVIYYKYYR